MRIGLYSSINKAFKNFVISQPLKLDKLILNTTTTEKFK